jgi:HSP20 family protein
MVNKGTAEATTLVLDDMPRVDDAIASVERLYEALTGNPPPALAEDDLAPIPVEKDPAEFVTERLDRLVEALDQPPTGLNGEAVWSPPMTVWEDGDELLICLDVAGVERQDLKLSDDGDSLTVSGKRKAAGQGMRLRMSELPLGPFRRKIVLPRGTGGADLRARLQDGALEIRIPRPKLASAGGRMVSIV